MACFLLLQFYFCPAYDVLHLILFSIVSTAFTFCDPGPIALFVGILVLFDCIVLHCVICLDSQQETQDGLVWLSQKLSEKKIYLATV